MGSLLLSKRTLLFEWYIARLVVMNGFQIDMYVVWWDGTMRSEYMNHSRFNGEHNGDAGVYAIIWKEKKKNSSLCTRLNSDFYLNSNSETWNDNLRDPQVLPAPHQFPIPSNG